MEPRERPILFSGPMVRAILEGRKTQTRRIIPMDGIDFRGAGGKDGTEWNDPACWGFEDERGREWALASDGTEDFVISCRYGVVGDRLWVREAWCHKADDDDCPVFNESGNVDPSCCYYKADGVHVTALDDDGFLRYRKNGVEASPWKSPLFMPRHLSRITLEITAIRVQRLQEISEEDAKAEGVQSLPSAPPMRDHQRAFKALWDEINGRRPGCSWEANPWVWAITFKRIQS